MCYNTFIKAVLKEFLCMQPYSECPQVLRDFLSYHESIKGQSRRTVSDYHLDLLGADGQILIECLNGRQLPRAGSGRDPDISRAFTVLPVVCKIR